MNKILIKTLKPMYLFSSDINTVTICEMRERQAHMESRSLRQTGYQIIGLELFQHTQFKKKCLKSFQMKTEEPHLFGVSRVFFKIFL